MTTERNRYWWQLLHNLVAHPLFVPWGFHPPQWVKDFHDYTACRAWPEEVPPSSPESWDTPGHHYVFIKPGHCQYQFVNRTPSAVHINLILCGVPDSIPECEIVSAPSLKPTEIPEAPDAPEANQ